MNGKYSRGLFVCYDGCAPASTKTVNHVGDPMPFQTYARLFALTSLIVLPCALASCSSDGSSPSSPGSHAALLGGASWQPMNSGTAELLWSVWSAKEEVISVGTSGTADHLKNGSWGTK